MKLTKRLSLFWLTMLAACVSQPVHQPDSLVAQLQQGGFVIFFRHGATDHSQQDTDLPHPSNCSAQRQLSEAGRQQAREIGEGFKLAGIPVGDAITSEYCRCVDTARIAFGKAQTSIDITSIQGVTPEERFRRIGALRGMLNTVPKPDTNTVIVAHQWMFKDASGQTLEEGEAAIFKPQSEGAALMVKKVTPEQWKELVKPATAN